MELQERSKKKQWSLKQIDFLKELYPQFSSKKWKKISHIFKQMGYQRSELQIRQRWTNYQDPNLLFSEWTEQQLQTLYNSYTKFGSKWCFIKKNITGRTQNKIKNKFYGNVRIFLRFVVNYFNQTKQDTMWIHKINPALLNDLYKGSEQFKQFGNIIENAIKLMGFKIDKIKLLGLIESQEQVYKKFYDRIILLYKKNDEANVKQQKTKQPKTKKKRSQSSQKYSQSNQIVQQQKVEQKKVQQQLYEAQVSRLNTFSSTPFPQNHTNKINLAQGIQPLYAGFFNPEAFGQIYPFYQMWRFQQQSNI